MRIEDLLPGQVVSLLVKVNETCLTFESVVEESNPKKHLILLSPIMHEGRAISFKGKGIIVNLVVSSENEKPHLFKNVTITLQKKEDGNLCYHVTTIAESVLFNRRENFRCFVGLPSSVQGGPNHAAYRTTIRDVSYTGFSIVCDSDVKFDDHNLLHVVLRDRLEELEENYAFHLSGLIARVQELENGNILYGCKLNSRVPGFDQYIMSKERLRLRRSNGGNL